MINEPSSSSSSRPEARLARGGPGGKHADECVNGRGTLYYIIKRLSTITHTHTNSHIRVEQWTERSVQMAHTRTYTLACTQLRQLRRVRGVLACRTIMEWSGVAECGGVEVLNAFNE